MHGGRLTPIDMDRHSEAGHSIQIENPRAFIEFGVPFPAALDQHGYSVSKYPPGLRAQYMNGRSNRLGLLRSPSSLLSVMHPRNRLRKS